MLKEIGQIRFWARFPGTVKPPAAQAVAPGARHARGGYPRRRARRSGRPGMPGIIRPSTWARECAACSRTKLRNRAAPAVERRYRVLERACVTAPVYPAGQDPGRDILAGPGFPKLRRAAKQRSGSVTEPGPVRQRPAGWSPFAGIARIRSLGVAVQPLSCPRPLSLSSRLRISPALRSVQLPRSPRRQYSRCMAPMTGSPKLYGLAPDDVTRLRKQLAAWPRTPDAVPGMPPAG